MEEPKKTASAKPKFLMPSIVLNIALLIIFFISYYVMQNTANLSIQNFYKKYQERRRDHFETLANTKDEIIFLGNSLTEACNWAELFQNPKIKNRGINSNKTSDVLNRINEVCEDKPNKIFLLIGTNDLGNKIKIEDIFKNYQKIVNEIRIQSPSTKLYIQSILPVNPSKGEQNRKNEDILLLNKKLEALAAQSNSIYIDLFTHMATSGILNPEYTNDGLHLLGKGYLKWKEIITKYIKE